MRQPGRERGNIGRVRGRLVLVILTGCGRLGFEPGGPDLDASPVVDTNPVVDASLALVCGPAYQVVSGRSSRYRVSTTDASWPAAERACEQDGGHLVVIDDADEEAWALTQVAGWIGLSDHVTEGVFVHVNGSAAGYRNWFTDEPNDSLGREDCGQLLVDGTWNDKDCAALNPYLCECDGAAMPAPPAWCETGTDASCDTCGDACVGGAACTSSQTCVDPS